MLLTLQSDIFTDHSTGSELSIDGKFECYTLELPMKDGLPGSAIPAGLYPIRYIYSHKFSRLMPHIEEIPGRSDIMLHWGNEPDNTTGCVLVGESRDAENVPNWISHSRAAWEKLNWILAPECAKGPDAVKINVIRRV